ncbi:hypothetical protein BO71DRAFT_12577 [Aspergillus ellipticus CBS 707.79]|uniref:Uncharacterized protein n=1 Tax=Aspergillus ellipticus CBS 707.79 TaxID=1448320 RepID=A0A319DF81_9EURO|nr:hypothetical protein BO71DRAFT_12577 [Aspergillus ellipticus CBS 707.79]
MYHLIPLSPIVASYPCAHNSFSFFFFIILCFVSHLLVCIVSIYLPLILDCVLYAVDVFRVTRSGATLVGFLVVVVVVVVVVVIRDRDDGGALWIVLGLGLGLRLGLSTSPQHPRANPPTHTS